MHREMTSELRHGMYLRGCVGGSSVLIESGRWIASGLLFGAVLLPSASARADGGR